MATATTTASQIAAAAGISGTNIGLGGTNTRNLANRGGAISYGNCRWGINIPAWQGAGSFPAFTLYSDSANIDYSASYTYPLNWESISGIGQSLVEYTLLPSGTGKIRIFNNQTGDDDVAVWTWLTAGSAGSFTARFDLSSGTLHNSTATGTDISLSTGVSWAVLAESTYTGFTWSPNPASASASGTLTIKDSSSNVLITRSLSLSATANMNTFEGGGGFGSPGPGL